jgi:selenide,water dikinase
MIKLTQFSKGSGCGCKIAPEELAILLKTDIVSPNNEHLLVGNATNDDAAALAIDDKNVLVSTTDFFMPMVDDAFTFGQIAACNAISDVYAMGAKPILALGILGWPLEKISATEAQQVLNGARTICHNAGISLSGGHSIESNEPFFGLSVNGMTDRDRLKQNSTAKVGDYLFLTKPLGVGILSSALKRGIIKDNDYHKMLEIMTTLNSAGYALSSIKGVNAMTDVTGFGLLGHLSEMTRGSNLSAELFLSQIPLIENIEFYNQQFCFPDITTKNYNAYKDGTDGLTRLEFIPLCDPQTSGGLLISVSEEYMQEYLQVIKNFDLFKIASKPIGKMVAKSEKSIYLKP